MLELSELKVNYGKIEALKGVSLNIKKEELVCIIGSNGSGKSTMLKTISGLLKVKEGKMVFEGQNIHGMLPEKIVKMGIIHVPEGRIILCNLSVKENLLMGAYCRSDRNEIEKDVDNICYIFPQLRSRLNQLGGTLSGGEQQMLAIGRGLMAKPRLLLLDEPSLGLAPLIVTELFGVISRIRKEGATILLVEQNARQALMSSDRGYVMQIGRIVLEDSSKNLLADEQVIKTYMGASR